MTTKDYLNQISYYNKIIDNKLIEITQYKELSYSISAVVNEERVMSSSDPDKTGCGYVRLEQMEESLDKLIDKYIDVKNKIINSAAVENSEIGKKILSQLEENMEIAEREQIPICQDTGMAVVFLKVGQDVHFEGGSLEDAVNEGVRQGYVEGFLRKSVVGDPIIRENTKDNTPAVIHYSIVPGDKVEIKVAPKGFGSENMSRVVCSVAGTKAV